MNAQTFWLWLERLTSPPMMQLLMFVLLVVLSAELNRIHRHLHYLECAQLGYVTDVDGSEWDESRETCARMRVR
jgi:hypothetical protein